MGFRFRKSIKAGPLRVNLSKSGVGYSVGTKGFRYTKKAGGGTRTTASIPGTGVSYVSETGKKKSGQAVHTTNYPHNHSATPTPAPSSQSIPAADGNRMTYCTHCYKMIPYGSQICCACGKPQTSPKTPDAFGLVTLVLGTWLLATVLTAFIVFSLDIYPADGLTSFICLLTIGVAPLAITALVTLCLRAKMTQTNNISNFRIDTPVRPSLNADINSAVTQPLTNGGVKNTATEIFDDNSDKAAAILRSYQEKTFQDTTEKLRNKHQAEALDAAPEHSAEKANTSKPALKSSTHRVTGMEHYMDNILALATENDDYNMSKREIIDEGMVGERIWKYEFNPVYAELVPEPDNPYDPNAIMVMVDGEHVGYIKKGSCARIHKLLNEGRLQSIDCEIGGGPYKIVEEEEDDDGDETLTLYKESTKVFVHLTVYEFE